MFQQGSLITAQQRLMAVLLLTLATVVLPSAVWADCPSLVWPDSRLSLICAAQAANNGTSLSTSCSLYTLCTGSTSPALSPTVCNSNALFTSLCLDVGEAGLPECAQYRAMVASSAEYTSCLQASAYPVYDTAAIAAATISSCKAMGDMDGCDTCTSTTACPDPLASISRICLSMPMDECAPWTAFCSNNATSNATPRVLGDGVQVLCRQRAQRTYPVAGRLPSSTCYTNPSQASCASVTYPDASIATDILAQCGNGSAATPACSVWAACQGGSVTGASCAPFRILATLCKAQPNALSCAAYSGLCASGTRATQCSANPTLANLPTVSAVSNSLSSLCWDASPSAACPATCATVSACSNPLTALSTVCYSSSLTASQQEACAPIRTWCSTTGSGPDAYCKAPTATASPPIAASPAPAPALAPQVATASPPPPSLSPPFTPPATTGPETYPVCVTNSSVAGCAGYVYPADNVNEDIVQTCRAMSTMPGCSVSRSCAAGTVTGDSCQPFKILATLCTDMNTMTGCTSYNSLCSIGSQVQQCLTYKPLAGIPDWRSAREDSLTMCQEMPMEACNSCTELTCPDPLQSLSDMCRSMPGMDGCSSYVSWCSSLHSAGDNGLDHYCGGTTSNGIPSMLMYFHQRYHEVILWRRWLPNSQAEYAGSIIGIILIGVVTMGLKSLREGLSLRDNVYAAMQHQDATWWRVSPMQFVAELPRVLLTGVTITLDLCLMLIAMTFNTGLFIAVVGGYFLGAFIFSPLLSNYRRSLSLKESACDARSSSSSDAAEKGELYKAQRPLTGSSCGDCCS